MNRRTRYLIVGAGPTGLAAATRLEQLGVAWKLFEAEEYPGGLSASFQDGGYTWDLGGHVVFSHYDFFDRMLDSVLAPDEWLQHDRNAYVRTLDRWIPYPFQNNIRYLPEPERLECLEGLRKAQALAPQPSPGNFQEWIDRFAGDGIARLFLNPYNRKVWAYPPAEMSAHWLGERVARPDVAKIERSINSRSDDVNWGPNARFRFPRQGGTGQIWRNLAARLPADKVHYGCRLTAVDMDRRTVSFQCGREESYDCLVTTIPLDELARLTRWSGIREAEQLVHNSVHVVGAGFKGSLPPEATNKTWMYFPEASVPFYRVTVFSSYSTSNVLAGCYSLMAEVAESPVTPVAREGLIDRCVEGFRSVGLAGRNDAVTAAWQRRVEHGYPVPSLGRDAILNRILPMLEEKGIYSRGRFGAWKYEVANMDHSFAQGLEVAERLVEGKPERTVNDPELVNSGGRRTG